MRPRSGVTIEPPSTDCFFFFFSSFPLFLPVRLLLLLPLLLPLPFFFFLPPSFPFPFLFPPSFPIMSFYLDNYRVSFLCSLDSTPSGLCPTGGRVSVRTPTVDTSQSVCRCTCVHVVSFVLHVHRVDRTEDNPIMLAKVAGGGKCHFALDTRPTRVARVRTPKRGVTGRRVSGRTNL